MWEFGCFAPTAKEEVNEPKQKLRSATGVASQPCDILDW